MIDMQNGHAVQTEEPAPSSLYLLLPPQAEVDIVEWIESVEGICEPRVRRARISCFVPMKIFHRMLAGRERVLMLRHLSEQQTDAALSEHSGDYLDWVTEMVVEVWKLTEPRMTREILEEGIDIDQILALFERFFGAQMRRFADRTRMQRAMQNLPPS